MYKIVVSLITNKGKEEFVYTSKDYWEWQLGAEIIKALDGKSFAKKWLLRHLPCHELVSDKQGSLIYTGLIDGEPCLVEVSYDISEEYQAMKDSLHKLNLMLKEDSL